MVYDWQLDEQSGTRSKVFEGSLAGVQMRGFTQHSVQKQEKGELRSVAPAGKQVSIDQEVTDAICKSSTNLVALLGFSFSLKWLCSGRAC